MQLAGKTTTSRASTLLAIWLSAGVVLTTATQLRPGGLSVGPGEMMLFAWVIVAFTYLLWNGRLFLSPPRKVFILFWFSSFFFLISGWLVALYLGLWNRNGFHDFAAFLFAALIFAGLMVIPDLRELSRQSIKYVLHFTVLPLVFLLIYGHFHPRIGFIEIWFGEEIRFTGWATNPNQLALLLAAIPFVGFHLVSRSEKVGQKVWYGLLILASIPVAILSKSDALAVGWGMAFTVMVFLLCYRAVFDPHPGYWKAVFVYIYLPLGVLCFMVVLGYPVFLTLRDMIADIYYLRDQGSVRIALWLNGLKALAVSPLFGLGPGAYSGISRPFIGSEAHNTLIDWGVSVGIIGLLIYFGLLAWVIWLARLSKNDFLLYAIVAMVGFSLFHYVLRQPLFWFYLVIIAELCSRSAGISAGKPQVQGVKGGSGADG